MQRPVIEVFSSFQRTASEAQRGHGCTQGLLNNLWQRQKQILEENLSPGIHLQAMILKRLYQNGKGQGEQPSRCEGSPSVELCAGKPWLKKPSAPALEV